MKKLIPVFLLFLFIRVSAQNPIEHTGCVAAAYSSFEKIDVPASYKHGERSAGFSINYIGFTPAAQAVLDTACAIWNSIIVANVPIKLNAVWTPLVAGSLGITLPNGNRDFIGALQPNTWFASCLANTLNGSDLDTANVDMDLFLNSSINWYFGTDGNCPAAQWDLESTILHELCHGLGFLGLSKVSGTTGSFGTLLASDFAPIATSFPWPDLDTLPGMFDRFLQNASAQQLIDTGIFPNPSTALKTAMTNGQVYFSGPYELANNSGVRARVYAPSAFALGSSMTHLNDATYPPGNPNNLMVHASPSGAVIHDPGPITVGILKDIGWQINPAYSAIEENISPNEIKVFPNITNGNVSVVLNNSSSEKINYSVMNSIGAKICEGNFDGNILRLNFSSFPAGIYFIHLESKTLSGTARVVRK